MFILDDGVSGQEIKNRTIEVVKLGFSEEEVKQQLRKSGTTLGNRKLRTSQTTTSTKHEAQSTVGALIRRRRDRPIGKVP